MSGSACCRGRRYLHLPSTGRQSGAGGDSPVASATIFPLFVSVQRPRRFSSSPSRSHAWFVMLSSSSLSCEHCGETFHRREHRDRHQLRHTGARPFPCNVCSKTFSRNDTLTRHLTLHRRSGHSSRRNSHVDSSVAVGRRGTQACLSCARLKQRCEGGFPCPRCLLRTSECRYPCSERPGADTPTSSALSSGVEAELPAASSPDCTIPLVQPEPVAFNEPLDEEDAFDGISNTINMAYDPGMDFSFPWTMPWPMDGLEWPTETSSLTEPLGNAVTSATRDLTYLDPQHICSRYAAPCPPFPEPQAMDMEVAGAEIYGHVTYVSEHSSQGLHDFYRTQQQDPGLSPPIPTAITHAFIDLYFEHFAPDFPFLHPSRLEEPDVLWILLLATIAVGSHYSEIPQASKYHLVLCELLERAVETVLLAEPARTDIVTVQVVFLLHVLWTFSGSHRDKVVQQQKKSILMNLCRNLPRKTGRREYSHPVQTEPPQRVEQEWETWLAAEEQVRLLSCVRGEICFPNARQRLSRRID
jgi:hypothetical protein